MSSERRSVRLFLKKKTQINFFDPREDRFTTQCTSRKLTKDQKQWAETLPHRKAKTKDDDSIFINLKTKSDRKLSNLNLVPE